MTDDSCGGEDIGGRRPERWGAVRDTDRATAWCALDSQLVDLNRSRYPGCRSVEGTLHYTSAGERWPESGRMIRWEAGSQPLIRPALAMVRCAHNGSVGEDRVRSTKVSNSLPSKGLSTGRAVNGGGGVGNLEHGHQNLRPHNGSHPKPQDDGHCHLEQRAPALTQVSALGQCAEAGNTALARRPRQVR